MKIFFYAYRKIFYFIIALLLNLAIVQTESWAQRWIVHTIPQVPGESVNDLLIDAHGNIWCATENGVGRFNGEWVSFRINDGLVNNQVRCIALDEEGSIWFGTENGVSKIDPTSDINNPANWKNYTTAITNGGLVSNRITNILIYGDRTIWFGTDSSGICSVNLFPDSIIPGQDPLKDKNNWKSLTEKNGLICNQIIDIEKGVDSLVWIATNIGINIYNIESDSIELFDLNDWEAENSLRDIFKDRSNNIWIGTARRGAYKVFPDNLKHYDHYTTSTTDSGLVSDSILNIYQDREGGIWFGHGSKKGASVLKPSEDGYNPTNWMNFNIINGLGDYNVYSIVEDFEENILFAHSEKKGISQLSRSWYNYLIDKELEKNLVNDLFIDNRHHLWIGTDEGVFCFDLNNHSVFLEKQKRSFTPTVGLIGDRVFSIFQDSRSFLWFGTDKGLSRVSSDQMDDWIPITKDNGLSWNKVNCITEDKSHYLWIGTNQGISRVHVDSVLTPKSWIDINVTNGLISNVVKDILRDQENNLWIGTDNGINFLKHNLNPQANTNWVTYDTSNGLVHNEVNSLFQDMQGLIWIGTERGVNQIDPTADLTNPENWVSFSIVNGLVNDWVMSIGQLKQNHLWFATANGVSKLDLSYIPFKWTNYTTSSGLAFNRVHSLMTDVQNQDVWFGTRGGGVSRYRMKSIPPKTHLTSRYDVVTENSLTYSFYGADVITSPQDMYFEYCLDDTTNWTNTFDNFVTVFFDEVDKPELHTFYARAVDSDGNVDRVGVKDSFYKISSTLGGNIELASADFVVEELAETKFRIRLLVPPGVLNSGSSLEMVSLKNYKLLDSSNVILAVEVRSRPSIDTLIRPATFSIKFPKETDFETKSLRIFKHTESKGNTWQLIGGTVECKADTIVISTAITDLGIYALRDLHIIESEQPTDLNIEPRIFSPAGGGKGHGDLVTISFQLSNPSNTTIKIYNIAGRLKRIVRENVSLLSGTNAVDWNGRDESGNVCPTGLYIVTVEAEGKVKTKTVMISNQF